MGSDVNHVKQDFKLTNTFCIQIKFFFNPTKILETTYISLIYILSCTMMILITF